MAYAGVGGDLPFVCVVIRVTHDVISVMCGDRLT